QAAPLNTAGRLRWTVADAHPVADGGIGREFNDNPPRLRTQLDVDHTLAGKRCRGREDGWRWGRVWACFDLPFDDLRHVTLDHPGGAVNRGTRPDRERTSGRPGAVLL